MAGPDTCRLDAWLGRARLAKPRAIAAALVEAGAVRLTHQGRQNRLDKPSRAVHPGDTVLIVMGGRLTEVRVETLGERRGPASEARALYALIPPSGETRS